MVWSRLPGREAEIVGKDKNGVAHKQEDVVLVLLFATGVGPPASQPRVLGADSNWRIVRLTHHDRRVLHFESEVKCDQLDPAWSLA